MLTLVKKFSFVFLSVFVMGQPLFTLAATNPCVGLTPWECGRDVNAGGAGLPGGAIIDIISSTLSWLLAVLGFIAIAGFVISGLLYLTAAGNEGQAEQAKNAMKFSMIGVIVALIGYVAIQAIDALLDANAFF